MNNLPSGTITFLFTDVHDSTRLWEKHPADMGQALQRHDEIIESLSRQHNGHVVRPRGEGDSRFVVFERAFDGVSAAAAIQQALHTEDWPEIITLRVRMAVNTGEGEFRDGDYYGPAVNRCARLRGIAHGGQTLLSQSTFELVQDNLPEEIELFNLGKHPLKGMMRPEHIYQVMAPGLPINFPSLSLDQKQIEIPSKLPPFLDLDPDDETTIAPRPVFVARDGELAHLNAFLEKAIDGNGQVVFITGGAGRGKTALIDEFCFRAQGQYDDLITARGNCNAHTGVGDPYLPFRDITGMLTGDIESSLAAGNILPDHAKRLWNLLPQTVDAMLKRGPSLVDVLVHGDSLLDRTETANPENVNRLRQLKELVERNKTSPSDLDQSLLFEQFTNVLLILAEDRPLILFLDDMQWADSASIDLLFHLGRRIEGHPILLISAYRDDEVALGRDDQRHPLENPVNELKRLYGDIFLDLSRVGQEEDFVEQYLDTDPNRLDSEFRQTLKTHTGGHPLFTVELLREMMDRGDLIKDDEDYWIESPELSWKLLPARVEAVIEERVERLDDDLKEVLSIASVEGEEFTVQVIAEVQKVKEHSLQRKLSQQLEKTHRLVHAGDELKVDGRILSHYRFRHQLYQHYLYNDLSTGERRLWHGDIAAALEGLHQGETRGIAVQLAHHYSEAQDTPKASKYLLEAAELAREKGGYVEASKLLDQIIAFGDEVDLLTRIRTLEVKSPVLHTLGEYDACLLNDETLLKLAQESQDQDRLAEAYFLHGTLLHDLGNLPEAIETLDQAAKVAKGAENQKIEAKVFGYTVLPLIKLGKIDEAKKFATEAFRLAKAANDDLILARNLTNIAVYYTSIGDTSRAVEMLQHQLEITTRLGSLKGRTIGLANLGFNYVMLGMYPEGISHIKQALEIAEQIGYIALSIHTRWNLCLAYLRMGNPEEAVTILEEVDPDEVSRGYLGSYHSFFRGLAREGINDYAQAKENFLRGVEMFLEMDFTANANDCLAGKARCIMRLGEDEAAQQITGELWNYLQENGSSGMELPILAYLTCAEIFQAVGDTNNFIVATKEGHSVLIEMANKIRSYLENVPEHQMIIDLWNKKCINS